MGPVGGPGVRGGLPVLGDGQVARLNARHLAAMHSALGPPSTGPWLALKAGRGCMYFSGNRLAGVYDSAQIPLELAVPELAVYSLRSNQGADLHGHIY